MIAFTIASSSSGGVADGSLYSLYSLFFSVC
jgi:hypothetical protein